MQTRTNSSAASERDFRVSVIMPTGRDAVLVRETLTGAGLTVEVCADVSGLEEHFAEGVGVILLAEEALQNDNLSALAQIVDRQPVWSDLPVILLASNPDRSDRLSDYVGDRLNITILDRPLQKSILVSSIKGALRARRRQYQTRDLLKELEEADRQKDVFLATLSHELRTPLNSMLGWIQMLGRESSSVDRSHALKVIERNARAQTQIINDILTLSRVVTGKLEMDFQSIDLNAVIAATVDVVQPLTEGKNITVETWLEKEAFTIEGDFDRMQQVFWNLLSNAVKFTPDGGAITIRTERAGDQGKVSIGDNGKGMAPEFIPYAFERFRQADSSLTRRTGGLGLGLAIVRTIVEQHGGTVSVQSEGEGKGTTFTLELPLRTGAAADGEPTGTALPVGTRTFPDCRVVLAEDDDDARDMLTFLLREYDIEVEAVASGTAALEAVMRCPPTVLISDVSMPDVDGYDLIRRIRELPEEQGGRVPAIALTGYAGIQDRARSMRAGYQAHLSKPIDFEELFQTIERLCAGPRPTTGLSPLLLSEPAP